MAEMAGRITSLERLLTVVTSQKALVDQDSLVAGDPSRLPDDRLMQDGTSTLYFNEILTTRVIDQDKDIKAALTSPHVTHMLSPFHAMGISSSPHSTQEHSVFHPKKSTAIELWDIYLSNVEICVGLKLTHVPTDEVRVYSTIDQPHIAKLDDLAFCYSVYFAATISLETTSLSLLNKSDKLDNLQRYKTGMEQAFASGDFLNRPTLTSLRALAIYLSALRVHQRGKASWVLNGVAIRAAQSLGIHKDGTQLGLSFFESELRRRLWWHLITRDSRAAEDYGFDDAGTLVSCSEAKLPLNIDDADMHPDMEAPPSEKLGWTPMTFSLINIDLARAMENFRVVCCDPSEEKRKTLMSATRSQVERRLDKVNPITPQQRLTVHCSHFLLQKLDFSTDQQWLSLHRRDSSGMLVDDDRLLAAVQILEFRTFSGDLFLAQFTWARKVHPQYHITLYVLWHLCVRPESLYAERARKAVDSIFAQEMADEVVTGVGPKLMILKTLRSKADARLRERRYEVEPSLDDAISEPPMLSDSYDAFNFIDELNFDDMAFDDGAEWSTWTSLLQGFQSDEDTIK
ncbi:hypothetical protein FHETE_5970 [Fusarium heterosporum]|uniref:Xylanolytic transcriptional activator regulatory domain-containing protein n=1 Tax=Fusarium heterosporum TaxID=42747 RepID=A0A8H5TEW0_FUSHE|nr:hypothetical protein FHETE_5970 [Fusarium heterosporum]